jgi:hypothetical protein
MCQWFMITTDKFLSLFRFSWPLERDMGSSSPQNNNKDENVKHLINIINQ